MSLNHSHRHEHGHNHDIKNINSFKLFFTIIFNIIITLAEILGGLFSGSLALLSDAFHNLSDVFALVISYIANLISRKNRDNKRTFGYKRAEILAALFNVILLFIACVYIIFEAVKRLFNPSDIKTPIMLIIAVIGFLGNAFSIILLFNDSKGNLNIKSAFIHLLGDTLSSVAVIITGVLILFFPKLYLLDPIISILIAGYIVKESISILLKTINILMQGKPSHIDIDKIGIRLINDKELKILNIHHIHVWSLSLTETIIDFHVVIKQDDIKNIDDLLTKINNILLDEYDIHHSTIQIETENYNHAIECCF